MAELPAIGAKAPDFNLQSDGGGKAKLADFKGRKLAPHFAMEIHLHLAAAYPQEPWLEHFEWLEPMFNERLELKEGRMHVPNRSGLGFSLSDQALAWTAETAEFGKRP